MPNDSMPPYATVLTAPGAIAEIDAAEQSYFAAVSADDPPVTAQILYTSLQYPTRLKSQLRENLKKHNIHVTKQYEVTPRELADVYASAGSQTRTAAVDVDYDRGRDQISALLTRAVKDSASDIHIVRRRRSAAVSFRINGQIAPHSEWSQLEADRSCRFIYESMCQDQEVTWNPHEPQDAVMDTTLPDGRRVRVRVGTIPASPDGYDMVLRIMPGSGDTLHLNQLGYEPAQIASIRSMVRRPSGLVVMAGGVGSGKSTSLVGMLHQELEMHPGRLRIITVEDPPERVIPGATQVPVVRRRGRTDEDEFAFAIRGALRCDPDTLMVGEIRDLQSAQLTIKFAQSGHRVYTTVHAATAIGIVGRLSLLGVDAKMLCTPDVLKGLIFQTLVPHLCRHCKISTAQYVSCADAAAPRRRLVERARRAFEARGHDIDQAAWRPQQGCSICNRTGVSGRVLMAEIVVPDEAMQLRLAEGDYAAAHRYWLRHLEGQPAHEQGLRLAADGTISPAALEWETGPLDALPMPTSPLRSVIPMET